MMIEKQIKKIAILSSGGIESSALIANYAAKGYCVYPLYIAAGFYYEQEEILSLRRFVASLNHQNVKAPVNIKTQLDNIYEGTWMTTNKHIPLPSEDERIKIPGRNLFLLTMAVLWCETHDCYDIAIGILGDEGFHDQKEDFLHKCEDLFSYAKHRPLKIHVDFRGKSKKEIIKMYAAYPLHLTMSCLKTKKGVHCGICNKCFERQQGFYEANIQDLTCYIKNDNFK